MCVVKICQPASLKEPEGWLVDPTAPRGEREGMGSPAAELGIAGMLISVEFLHLRGSQARRNLEENIGSPGREERGWKRELGLAALVASQSLSGDGSPGWEERMDRELVRKPVGRVVGRSIPSLSWSMVLPSRRCDASSLALCHSKLLYPTRCRERVSSRGMLVGNQ